MRGARRTRARAVALTVGILVAAIWPAGMRAAHLWSIATSTSSVTQHVSTGIGLTVTNQSTTNSDGDSIGCVKVTIPNDFTVDATSVDSVTNGYTWTASQSGSGPTIVTFAAMDDNHRLRGDPDFDVLQATITVTPSRVGSHDWSATEWERDDCTTEQLTQVLPMTVTAGLNQPPAASSDAVSVVAGDTLSVAAPGVLQNDSDADGDALDALLVNDVSNGTLSLGAGGAFDYTPDPGFAGTDTFTYQAFDGSTTSAAATVTITVTNSTPGASDDAYAARKNVLLTPL